MSGILDTIFRRGKRTDVEVGGAFCFKEGMKVTFGRFSREPVPHYEGIGEGVVRQTFPRFGILRFDALPKGVRVGDMILCEESPFTEVMIRNVP